MADSKLIIELEVKQVQEQLMKLFEERKNLQKEFEQLTGSSHQLLLEIKEDPTSASERKLHNYEAEKRRIEEKLELLENEISEKDKRITLLDSKAGLFLQQVSTTPTSNNLSNTDDKVEIDIIGNESTSAVTVGEGGKSVEGARDGAHEVDIKCSDTADVEVGQSVVDSQQATEEQDHKVQECNHSESTEIVKVESHNGEAEVIQVTSPEELHKDTDEDAATPKELPEPPPADTEVGETTGMADAEATRGEEKCKGQDNHVIDDARVEIKSVMLVDDKESCSGVTGVEEEKSEIATYEPMGNGISDEKEELNESEVQSQIEVGEEKGESQETTCNEPKDIEPAAASPGPAGAASLVQGTPAEAEGDNAGKQTSDYSTPLVLDQVTSLSMLVAELRRVKDDMGKCMTVKEQSFLDLEDQLQAANKEVASLKNSVSTLSKDLEEKKQGYQALEEEHKKKKMDIELKIGEIQEVTNKCSMLSDEKSDLLRKMEVLEIMMTEYRTEIEMLVGEKNQMEQQTKQLLAAKTAATTAEAEIDSRTSVEEKEREIEELVEKIQSMEKEMKELNDKLKVTNRHLKVMAREREYKQKECEILKHKVEMVELKMCELQGTFDMLMKAVMVERDDLIKEMEVKNSQIDDLQQTVVRLKDTHEQELENVLYEKRLNDEELTKYRSGEMKTESYKKALQEITNQKECLEQKLKEKTDEAAGLDEKVKTIRNDMTDFVNSLKDEMARIKDDSEKLQQEKTNLSETFNSLQGEHKELQSKHQALEKSFEEVDKSNKEKLVNVESLKIQLDDLQKQLESVNAKNANLSSEMFRKEEESREELSAREATIQELTVTLTNNQKQSMENYNALQQDMNNLQAKFKTSTEEHKKQQKELEERLKGLEKEKTKEINTLQEEIKSLKKELGDKNKKLEAAEKSKSSKDTKGQEDKDKEIEALNEKIEELTKSLETAASGTSKGKEGKTTSKTDAEDLQQKVKDLTAELATLKKPESGSEASKTQEEFETSLEGKEKKIQLLESKVSDLEMSLANKSGYITQLEERIKDSPDVPNSAEAHLEQINKLSADISKLKEELKQTYEECKFLKNTVTQLENDKKSIEDEKAKLVEEYESKLEQASGNLEESNVQLEQKKNSVERLELELRTSSNRYLEEVANLESNHIGRIADLVKLHRQKVEVLKAGNAAKVSELLVHIDKLTEQKMSLENELKNATLEQSNSSLSSLIQERDSLITKITDLEHTCKTLEKDKLLIEEEKKTLKNSFKEEQVMTMEIQSQMVADSEKLILELELNKSSLEKQIEAMESLCEQHSLSIVENEKKIAYFENQNTLLTKEKEKYIDENKRLKTVIEETVSKINIDEEQPKSIEKLTTKDRLSEVFLNISPATEPDKTGGDDLKQEGGSTVLLPKVVKEGSGQDKKKAVLEYEDKISSIIANYQEQISSLTTKYEAKRVEENAEFGRVLVAKIDSYEKQIASQDEEINGLRTEITKLQMDISDKVKIIEELEANLDDMTLMRASLRAQVNDLKLAITKANLSPTDQSCLDVLHTEYETRINEIQEYYEAQLNTLRSCLPGTDVELQAVSCRPLDSPSHSQESEYSIELSCLRPFLQGQSSPAELRSQSAQDSHFSVFGDTSEAGNQVSSLSSCLIARSPFDVVTKCGAQSRLPSDKKTKASKSSPHSQIKRKSILKAKAKCKLSSSMRHIVLDSASRSELRLLKSSLSPREEQTPQVLPQTVAAPHFAEQTTTTTITTSIRQSFNPVTSLQQAQIQSSTEQYPPPCTDDQASAILSAMGAVPKPPCQATTRLKPLLAAKPNADGSKEVPPAPGSSTTAALSSTTHHSDLDPNTTALDKYRIKVELSACCIPSAVIADWGWDSDSETSTKPSLPFFGDFRQLTILSH
ncbi:hypothetical protein E2C01_001580 [Portunus trituberculatus]|uniref:Uncharacterized protein n=1 Tax=Portunus trituberculatus TaxID=210409 RepID=A0A5B7CHZ6_PORTR|nr:hypothetical protein [Portunus trituberculatus]